MQEDKYKMLKLSSQLCFPLYACSKEIVKKYKPFLDKIDLTYTQYITMMVMWENEKVNVKELGNLLYLDSGTLTPVLKKLEQKKFISRCRDKDDERVLNVSLTAEGRRLKDKALEVPEKMSACLNLNNDETELLHNLLDKVLKRIIGEEA